MHRDLRIALNQRKQIVDIRLAHTVACCIDPFQRNLLFGVRTSVEIDQLDLALIIAVFVRLAAES